MCLILLFKKSLSKNMINIKKYKYKKYKVYILSIKIDLLFTK